MKKLTKFEVNLRSCNSCVQMRLLNCFQFPRCDVFYLNLNFSKNLYKIYKVLWFFKICINNWNKKLCKIFNYKPCNWVLSEYIQRIVFFEVLKIRSTGGAVHASFIETDVFVISKNHSCICNLHIL